MSQRADWTTGDVRPHLSAGELHAWLDGALDELGEARAVEAREHLHVCATCRDALSEEERVRVQADEVLALSAPRVTEVPSFEALVARAGGSDREPRAAGLSRAARLGWAASIVMALGAGWVARELGFRAPALPETTLGTSSSGATSAEAPTVATAAAMSGDGAPRALAPAELAETEQERPTSAPVVAEPDLAREQSVQLHVPIPRRIVATPVSAPPVSEFTLDPLVTAGAGVEQLEGKDKAGPDGVPFSTRSERRQVTLPQSALTSVNPSGIGVRQPTSGSAGGGMPQLFAGRADISPGAEAVNGIADPDEALDLAVPGLEVLRVEWSAVAPRQPSLRVLQRLPGGDTLEVRFVRAPPGDIIGDPLALLTSVPLEAGWSQFVKAHGDGWLVARAPLAREELEVLVERAGAR